MATINLSFTIPDPDVPDLVAAFKRQYATTAIPNPTQAQVVEYFRQEIMQVAVNRTKQYRADQLSAGAVAPVAT